MKNFWLFFFILACSVCSVFSAEKTDKPSGYIFEAEKFQFKGFWNPTRMGEHSILQVASPSFEPCSVYEIGSAGHYAVWCSAYDNLEISPGSRTFKVLINGQEMPDECGNHGEKTGLYWQKVGEVDLQKGEMLLGFRTKRKGARADAVYITKDLSFDPNGYFDSGINRRPYRVEPKQVDSFFKSNLSSLPELYSVENARRVWVENEKLKISYTQKKDASGKTFYVRSAELKDGKNTVELPEFKDEILFLTKIGDVRFYPINYFCSWLTESSGTWIKSGGKSYEIVERATNPFSVGENKIMRVVEVEKKSPRVLELKFENGATGELVLSEKGFDASLRVSVCVEEDGRYSLGFSAFNKVPKNTLRAVCMPPSYQLKHITDRPKLVCSSMLSQPYCAIENRGPRSRSYTNAVVANPDMFPEDEWSNGYNSPCGFAVVGASGIPQASMFSPVLGSDASKKKAGDKISAEFILVSMGGICADMIDYINNRIYASAHLREPLTVSLSTALENISEYLSNRDASGWCDYLKGRYNIEGQDMATNASPLAELQNALLTDSEEYYKNIALPAFEFALSRQTYHFIPRPGKLHSEGNVFALKLAVPSPAWGADFYASENAMMGGGNTWVSEFYDNRKYSFYAPVPDWTILFGRWLAEPENNALLDEAKASADDWLKRVYASDFSEPGVSFTYTRAYPFWYYLPDLYEATKDAKYLHYAVLGAYQTASCIWNYPIPKSKEMLIHKNGLVEGIDFLWYKGKEEYRMGYFETRGEVSKRASALNIGEDYQKYLYPATEHKVDAWQVSRIGVGIEAPNTLRASCHYRNIIMPAWAPELLRTWRHSGRDILMKFSRHAIIDRFANFYGYYVKDFTDIPLDPKYPYNGPDISSFYYHHAPCHFAYLYDYLMAQAESRAGENVKFPYVRTQGFVWFTNRIYGRVGKLFGQDALPTLEKGAVDTGTPKVSALTFRAEDSVWVLFLNDSSSRIEFLPKYNANSKLLRDADLSAKAQIYAADGSNKPVFANSVLEEKIRIPSLGLVALKIPAKKKDIYIRSQKPIKSPGHIAEKAHFKDLGADELHLFRIRSPFGKDSLYAVVVCDWQKNLKVSLNMNGKTYEDTSFPYEFSVYPLPQDADINATITVESQGLSPKSKSFVLGQ